MYEYELIGLAKKYIKDKEFRENYLAFITNISENEIEKHAIKYNVKIRKFNNDSLELFTLNNLSLIEKDDRLKKFLNFYSNFIGNTPETSLVESLNIAMAILIYSLKKDEFKFKNNELNIENDNLMFYFENKIDQHKFQFGFLEFLKYFSEKKIYDESVLANIFNEIDKKKEKIIINEKIQQLSIFYSHAIFEDETLRKINDLMFYYIKNIKVDQTELIDIAKFDLDDLKMFLQVNINDNEFHDGILLFIDLVLNSRKYDQDFKINFIQTLNQKRVDIVKNVLIMNIFKHFNDAKDYLKSVIYSDFLVPLALEIIKDPANNEKLYLKKQFNFEEI
jgi:hypothetical protein